MYFANFMVQQEGLGSPVGFSELGREGGLAQAQEAGTDVQKHKEQEFPRTLYLGR